MTAIDFARWHVDCGIKCVLFDIDGTLTVHASTCVNEDIICALDQARRDGVVWIGLVTNTRPRNELRVSLIASQVGARTYHLPRRWCHSKPSSYMILRALKTLGVEPDRAAFVGDKVVDILAAKRAGLARVVWVDRLGTGDHVFDRLVYRRIEPFLKRYFVEG